MVFRCTFVALSGSQIGAFENLLPGWLHKSNLICCCAVGCCLLSCYPAYNASTAHAKACFSISAATEQHAGQLAARRYLHVHASTCHVMRSSLQAQMQDFLNTSNSKPGMFRDVIYVPDYDPLSSRAHTIKIPTGAGTLDLSKAQITGKQFA